MRDEPGCYFAVAEWESQEARDAMSNDTHEGTSDKAQCWQKFTKNESLGESIKYDGGAKTEDFVGVPNHRRWIKKWASKGGPVFRSITEAGLASGLAAGSRVIGVNSERT